MRWFRFLPFLLTTVGVVLVAGALRRPAPRSTAQPPLAPRDLAGRDNDNADPLATSQVAEAITSLRDPAYEWLQTSVWVRSRLPELPYEGEGVYYRASRRRFRLEVRVRHDAGRHGERTMLTLGDGKHCWRATRTADGYRDVRRGPLDEKAADHLRGPEALLRSFENTIAWVHSRPETSGVTVTGIWHQSARKALAPPERPWPASLPRVCRLTLQGPQRWPARVEWFGPTADGGPDRLLVEMEFRTPASGRPLSEEQCAGLFTPNFGDAPVEVIAAR